MRSSSVETFDCAMWWQCSGPTRSTRSTLPRVRVKPRLPLLNSTMRPWRPSVSAQKHCLRAEPCFFMTSQRFSPTHKWRIPSICLAVKVRPRGLTIQPETKAELAGLDWPEFHNGVASVLELNLAADVKVDSKWIFAHLGEQVTARHAGFLYGLGLMKQLPSLTPVHVFRYLKMRNNLLTIGFLLGMAVSTVGTADPTARHLIGMQLTAFLPPGSAPLNLSTITQTAGLLAMGLVFLGSNHRWTAKRMLDQIGAQESPTPNLQPQHREAYSLSAGLALGLVYLGKGRGEGMKSLPDKRIVARLAHLVKGSINVR